MRVLTFFPFYLMTFLFLNSIKYITNIIPCFYVFFKMMSFIINFNTYNFVKPIEVESVLIMI